MTEQELELILEWICDHCHAPYQLYQEELDDVCAECRIEQMIKEASHNDLSNR